MCRSPFYHEMTSICLGLRDENIASGFVMYIELKGGRITPQKLCPGDRGRSFYLSSAPRLTSHTPLELVIPDSYKLKRKKGDKLAGGERSREPKRGQLSLTDEAIGRGENIVERSSLALEDHIRTRRRGLSSGGAVHALVIFLTPIVRLKTLKGVGSFKVRHNTL